MKTPFWNLKLKANSFASVSLWFICFLIFSHGLIFAGEDWPQFRGPDGQGHSDSKNLPQRWSETENVKWKIAIPGEGWSSPVILGNQIWMTTALDDGKSLRAICVDRTSGKILRDVEVFSVKKPGYKNLLNSYASPTPVIEGERAYVHFGTEGTACLSAKTGKILWRNRDLLLDHEEGSGSSPAIYRDKLIVPCDGTNTQYVVALNKLSGETLWKIQRSSAHNPSTSRRKAFCTPLIIQVSGHDQAIIPGADCLYAYEPESGKEIWTAHYSGYSVTPRPVFGLGMIFTCTGFDHPQLWAVRADGQGDVTTTNVVWKTTKQAPLKPSLLFLNEKIFMVSDGGIASCLDAKTGKEFWQERIGGEYSASPISAENKIYFFSQEGKSVIIDASEKFRPLATNELGDGFMASPAVAGNALFLRSKTHLYRIEN